MRTRIPLTIAVVAAGLLAACGSDDGDTSAASTVAAATTAAAPTTTAAPVTTAAPAPTTTVVTLDAFVTAMNPLCETFDAAVNAAVEPITSADGPPEPAVAQAAVAQIGTAIDTFVTAAQAVPLPTDAGPAKEVVDGYAAVRDTVKAANTPELAGQLFENDPRADVAKKADAIGLTTCGTGGAFGAAKKLQPSAVGGAPVTEIAAFDYGWKGLTGTLPTGEQVIHFTNSAAQDHEMIFIPLQPGADAAKVLNDFRNVSGDGAEALFQQVAAGPPSGVFAGPNGAAYATLDLNPGSYVVVCFLPDAAGNAHAKLGMAGVVAVS